MEENIVKQPLPSAQSAYILGILAIVFALVTTLVGLILGIIAVLEGNRAIKIYEAEPQQYSTKDYENAKTGKLLGWISIGISSFIILLVILIVVVFLAILPQIVKNTETITMIYGIVNFV
jgi:uncharacterized membrane protein